MPRTARREQVEPFWGKNVLIGRTRRALHAIAKDSPAVFSATSRNLGYLYRDSPAAPVNTIALTAAKTVWTWGDSAVGELGRTGDPQTGTSGPG